MIRSENLILQPRWGVRTCVPERASRTPIGRRRPEGRGGRTRPPSFSSGTAASASPKDPLIVNFRYRPGPWPTLRAVLARNPDATLDELRGLHPLFQRMSPDRLGVLLSQAVGGGPPLGAN